MTLRARFVDSISATPTVRLDLTASPWRILKSSQFNPPRIKRSRVSTLLVDGSQYPASAYDDRVLELHLQLEDATSDDAATAVQDLARELDRYEQNFFEYRLPEQTNSVFFRTWRLALESVDIITDGTLQRITAPVVAEPFGYGLEETLSNATIDNDPAGGVNPNYVDVSSVNGDVEAPMRIKKQQTGVGVALSQTFAFATRRRGTVANVPYLLQAEDMTQATDTSVQANDTDFSGAGSNYSRCTFATDATMASRLRVDEWPSSPSIDARGQYRVFGRFRKTVSGDTIRVQLRVGGAQGAGAGTSPPVELPEVTLTSGTSLRQIDLGLVQIPVGAAVRFEGPSGSELAAEGPRVELWAARDSGSGNLDIDYLIWVPADDQLGIIETTGGWDASADSGIVFDSYADLLYAHRDTGDAVVNTAVGQVTGSLPKLRPGVTNRIWYLDGVGPNTAHNINSSRTLELSYWPAYLSIRPAST